jgi:hypothetical protein
MTAGDNINKNTQRFSHVGLHFTVVVIGSVDPWTSHAHLCSNMFFCEHISLISIGETLLMSARLPPLRRRYISEYSVYQDVCTTHTNNRE